MCIMYIDYIVVNFLITVLVNCVVVTDKDNATTHNTYIYNISEFNVYP